MLFHAGRRFGLELAKLTAICVGLFAALGPLTSHCPAQTCDPQWIPNGAGQEISGNVLCMTTFDPDGAGPQPPLFVVGGESLAVRGLGFQKLIAFDGTTWRSLVATTQTTGRVEAMAVYNGELIIAGSFASVNGVTAKNIAKWNGTTWSALGDGVYSSDGGEVWSLAVSNGYLFVGGRFVSAGPGLPANNLARWNGANWGTTGGVTSAGGGVYAMVDVLGQLYVGGFFTSAGGVPATNLARYTPTTGAWAAMGNPNAGVRTLAQFTGDAISSARLYVGGFFTNIGGVAASGAARYAPSTQAWSSLGAPASRTICYNMFVRTFGINSHQVAAVWDQTSLLPPPQAYTLSGTTWSSMNGSAIDDAQAIGLYGGQYVLGTRFNADTAHEVLRWNGAQWAPMGSQGALGTAIDSFALDMTPGDLLAGTRTVLAGNTEEAYVTRRSGATGSWTRLPGQFRRGTFFEASINAVVSRTDGEVLAGGNFLSIDGASIPYLARWNGSAWSSVSGGVNGFVHAMLKLPNGDVIVGGAFTQAGGVPMGGVARWNGTTWSPLAEGILFGGVVYALTQLPNGDIFAGGQFNGAGGVIAVNIARWNGSAWSSVGSGTNNAVYALTPAPGGGVYAGGGFSIAGGVPAQSIARWNGSAWSALAPLYQGAGVYAISMLPDESLLVGGGFAGGGLPSNYLLHWNGSAWTSMDGGANAAVRALLRLPTGKVAVGGEFTVVGGDVSASFAQVDPIGCGGCDSIDFNNDGSLFDPTDIDAIFSVFSEGPCVPSTATCNDIDFNNDGSLFDPCDVDAFLLVFSEGPCTLCGQ